MKNVILKRNKNTDYIVNYNNKRYVWSGARVNIIAKKEVPQEAFEWLAAHTQVFKNGELVLSEDNENIEELKEYIYEIEDYEVNSISENQIKKMLNTTDYEKLANELQKFKVQSTKKFILDVAREIKKDSVRWRKVIYDWYTEGNSPLTVSELFNEWD